MLGEGALELVLADRTRVPLADDMTIGRAPAARCGSTTPPFRAGRRASSCDAARCSSRTPGSSYGTWLDGRRVEGPAPLRDGSRIRVGNQELVVERRRSEAEAGRTVVVPLGAVAGRRPAARRRASVPAQGAIGLRAEAPRGVRGGRGGGCCRDLESDRFLRMADADAELFAAARRPALAAPSSSREAEQRDGRGRARRGWRGCWPSSPSAGFCPGWRARVAAARRGGPLRRLAAPREMTWSGAGRLFERLYRRGGWRLFTPPALAAIAVLVVAGLVVVPVSRRRPLRDAVRRRAEGRRRRR